MNHTLTPKAGVDTNGQKLGNTTDGKQKNLVDAKRGMAVPGFR